MKKLNDKTLGIIYILFSAFCFAMMNVFVRLSGDLPSIQKSFFRNLVALIFALAILFKNNISLKPQKGENLKFLVVRALFGTLGILCNFYAVDHLVLSDASMLNKMSPFFVVILSMIFLREKATPFQIGSVVVAFIGAIFIIKPSFNFTDFSSSFIGFLGGLCAGIAYTAVRYLTQKDEKGAYIVFFFSAFSCLVTLPYLIFSYSPMTPKQVVFLLLAGLSASGGQFGITAAYAHAPAKEISVFDYSQILFSAILGFFLFNQTPDLLSIVGYFITISVAVAMFFYNKKRP